MIIILLSLALAQAAPPSHARVSLVAERDALVAGEAAWIGLRFQIEPGWHIYWTNPGDSGGPPSVHWQLPRGFQAGEVQWPAPQRIALEGLGVNYGYEGDVVLPLRVKVPKGASSGARVPLAASVKYQICKDMCVGGRASVRLDLPVVAAGASPSSASALRHLFETTRARLPKPLPAPWTVGASARGERLSLLVETGQREATAEFFPLNPGEIDESRAAPPAPLAHGVRLDLTRLAKLPRWRARLQGVLVLSPTRAYLIDTPIAGR